MIWAKLVIDYCSSMSGSGKSTDSQSAGDFGYFPILKALARELSVPVIALSSSREPWSGFDHRPTCFRSA